ncbi:hypothetical protein [Sphingomonas japonica]|uniref:Lipoprotein n=1 Tax=Sphingomonas japonica TaxID=511662 RepID=A0ABX0U0Y2_9SPHN|nr:hypothetical protein [Sphingomonas japonica]NIJ24230.1 hypothetical protein [Sphingomonas japonica]
MRSFRLSLLSVIALASCASKPVEIDANQCWSLSLGDKVKGTAVLFAHAAKDGCIECGASVSGRGCPGVGFATANDSVDQAYERILQSERPDAFGNVRPVVYLSGEVIPNGATGKPMIRASLLRLAKPGLPNGR